ncbi:hypothetical protein V9K67_05615 [Paraflavisolibacter sp. H34]|uniref:hypothetical protein n=1 Tax=Huijunlia imazamoxiresistens TaxID=3127457 RepID=UPI0030187F36
MRIKESNEDQNRIAILKHCIQKEFGRKISTANDCIELSEDIFQKTDETLNSNTLRRFFGLVTYYFNPSKTTLNILARYCLFSSFSEVPEKLNLEDRKTVSNESAL